MPCFGQHALLQSGSVQAKFAPRRCLSSRASFCPVDQMQRWRFAGWTQCDAITKPQGEVHLAKKVDVILEPRQRILLIVLLRQMF